MKDRCVLCGVFLNPSATALEEHYARKHEPDQERTCLLCGERRHNAGAMFHHHDVTHRDDDEWTLFDATPGPSGVAPNTHQVTDMPIYDHNRFLNALQTFKNRGPWLLPISRCTDELPFRRFFLTWLECKTTSFDASEACHTYLDEYLHLQSKSVKDGTFHTDRWMVFAREDHMLPNDVRDLDIPPTATGADAIAAIHRELLALLRVKLMHDRQEGLVDRRRCALIDGELLMKQERASEEALNGGEKTATATATTASQNPNPESDFQASVATVEAETPHDALGRNERS